MKGRYTVHLDDAPRGFPNRWHALVSVCRSLDRDGLHYRAELDLERRSVTIFAHGTPKTRMVKTSVLKPVALPKPLTLEQCGKWIDDARTRTQKVLGSISTDAIDETGPTLEGVRTLPLRCSDSSR